MAGPEFTDIDDSQAIPRAAAALAAGGVVVFPTDTVYGLLAGADSREAYNRVYRIKGRQHTSPLALLVHHGSALAALVRQQLAQYSDLSGLFDAGKLTVVLGPDCTDRLDSQIQQIQPGPPGVRQPADSRTQLLLELCGGLAWATSANASGQPVCTCPADLQNWLASLSEQPDLVVTATAPLQSDPSQVVRLGAAGYEWLRR